MTHPLDPKALEAAAEAIWETWASMPSPDAHPIYADRSWREVTALAEGSGGPAAEIVALARAEAASSITTYLHAVGDGWQPIEPIPMLLTCPAEECGAEHIDEGEWVTRPHKTHQCQSCGHEWRVANVPTVGVVSLPAPKQGDER